MSTTAPARERAPEREDVAEPDVPWIVIVWNDPINLMSYVVFVFQKLFGYSKEKATKLMLDVHQKGKAVVSSGPSTGSTATACGPPCRRTASRGRHGQADRARPVSAATQRRGDGPPPQPS